MEMNKEMLEALGAAFSEDEIKFLPRGGGNSGKARALPYVDARAVMGRLDQVVGPAEWSFDFDPLTADGKMIRGRLTVCGVTKCDAGEASKEEEPLKSAVSDALKRCAVHFGIGRYLYFLPAVWAPYDAQKRQFTQAPQLTPGAVDRALTICGFPAPTRPESRGDQRAADHSAAGKGEREAAISQVTALFRQLHEGLKFGEWSGKVLGRTVTGLSDLDFDDLQKLKRHLSTEAAVHAGQARQENKPAQMQGA